MKKSLALLLACFMLLAMFAACAKPSESPTDSTASPTDGTGDPADPTDPVTGDPLPLVYAIDNLSNVFNPYFSNSAYDQEVYSMCIGAVLGTDRDGELVYNGIQGEKRMYDGVEYLYTGPADVTVTQNPDPNNPDNILTTDYNIKLRDDLKFSDGSPVTIDNVLFTYYVWSDKSYDGAASFYSLPVLGLTNYRENNSLAETLSAEQVEEAMANLTDDQKTWIAENVIRATFEEELDWVLSGAADQYLGDAAATMSPAEKLAAFYSLDESYDGAGRSDEEAVDDLVAQYGHDYEALGNGYAGDPTYFAAPVYDKVQADLVASLPGEEVSHISGIVRVNDYECTVTTAGYNSRAIWDITGAEIVPIHHYGDISLWDYEGGSFGFPRGDVDMIRKNNVPMGTGPYIFKEYKDKVVYFEANPYYVEGEPKTKYVQFRETEEADKISALIGGTGDVANPSFSKEKALQIREANSNDDYQGDKLYTAMINNRGYGYIGISANTVNVGGEPGSDASKNLRKGLNTIISVCRDVPIDSYYVGTANVINYPISDISWAAPRKSDPGYKVAFSTKLDGSDIYDASMDMDAKYAAAVEAAREYLTAAGYTFGADGKATAAPDGASLTYTIDIVGGGIGDHPSFGILTQSRLLFEQLGIVLDIQDYSSMAPVTNRMDAGEAELWVLAWQSTPDPDLYQVYHSDRIGQYNGNRLFIADPELDRLIMESRESDDQTYRKAILQQCFDIIMDWGVEVPTYQRMNIYLFSAERVLTDTLTPAITSYWSWMNDFENIQMVR